MKAFTKIRLFLLLVIFIVSVLSFSIAKKPLKGIENADKSVVITHVTNPAMPGKLSVIVGDGWNISAPIVKIMKLENTPLRSPSKEMLPVFMEGKSKTLRIVKNNDETLICDLPDDKFSAFAVVAKGKEGWSEPVVVNVARVQWLSREKASAGDTVRIFGRNLVNLDFYPVAAGYEQSEGYGSYLSKIVTQVMIELPNGDYQACKVTKNSAYDASFVIPLSLTIGQYKVYAHNGLGGKYGWSDPLALTVEKPKTWPARVFNVKDYGAVGAAVENEDGWNDDAPAIQKALDAAEANGGGVVYFPAGNYYVSKTLSIPQYTTVRGESRERCWVWFPDAIDHGKKDDYETARKVEVGIRGISDFTLENLSIHSVYTNVLVGAPLAHDNAQTYKAINLDKRADNVSIKNCYLVHEPYYQYHYRKQDSLLTQSSQLDESWGMKATVALHGDNINITNSRIRGGGMCITLISCQYTNVARNELIIGRAANAVATREFGYPELPRPQKMILEDNVMWVASPVHHSGFWCHATSADFFIARNSLQLTWGCDSEGLLWHGWGPEQAYEVASATENTITVKDVDKVKALGWECIIVRGKGLGQKRIIKEINGNELVLDNPWKIIPAEGTRIALLYYHVHEGHIIIQNKLSDTGAGIFGWGCTYDWVVDGNSMTRGGGVMFDECAYSNDRPWSGNFFNQILHNRVDQGRYNNQITGRVWTIGYTGTGYCREFNRGVIGNLGHIYRGNLSTNDAAISFWDRVSDNTLHNYKGPLVDVGMVVEDNWFKDCNLGISVGDGVSGVIRGNNFNNVETKIRKSERAEMIQE